MVLIVNTSVPYSQFFFIAPINALLGSSGIVFHTTSGLDRSRSAGILGQSADGFMYHEDRGINPIKPVRPNPYNP
eukprot:4322405-Prymnesium_polylepis.1